MVYEQSEIDAARYWVKKDLRDEEGFSDAIIDEEVTALVSRKSKCLAGCKPCLWPKSSLEKMSRLS